jgi:GH24 family phage-related lysozyme (muramidase)
MPGVIKINPDLFSDKRDAHAVAWDEALRLWMEDTGFEPEFEVTPEQEEFFRGTAYGDDEDAMKKTIVARIATFDTSVKSPTPEQVAETIRLLESAIEVFDGQPDGETLKAMKAELESANKDTGRPVSQSPAQAAPVEQAPNGNIPAENAREGGEVPAQEQGLNDPRRVQSAESGGDVSEDVGYAMAIIRENEGFKPKAYWDKTGKKWTVGHGLTIMPDGRSVGPKDSITEAESLAAMRHHIENRLRPVAERDVAGWGALDPRLKAAMYDTAYNVGSGYFKAKSPNMARRLESGEDAAKVLAEENATWIKSEGVVVPGLVNRRRKVKERLIDWYVQERGAKGKK